MIVRYKVDRKKFFINLAFFVTTFANLHPDGFNYKECPPDQKKCAFWLVIQEKLTMIYEKNLVYAHNGKLYLYNEHHSNYTTEVSFYQFF